MRISQKLKSREQMPEGKSNKNSFSSFLPHLSFFERHWSFTLIELLVVIAIIAI